MTEQSFKIGDRVTVHDSCDGIVDRGEIIKLFDQRSATIRSDAGDEVTFWCVHLQPETA